MEHVEDHSRDPLGMTRFWETRVRDTKTSGENRPVTSGSASHPDPPPGLGSGAQDCEAVARVSLGTFNCGIDQQMLTCSNRHDHEYNLRRITKNALRDGCHVLAFCEAVDTSRDFKPRASCRPR